MPLHRNVFRALREAILTGQLEPGQVISEIDISRRWAVSRTPIREAIRQLEQDGLVLWSPRRGATVASITFAGVRDLYETREVLEALSARLAAERATAEDLEALVELVKGVEHAHQEGNHLEAMRLDNDFHRAMVRATPNRVLTSFSERLLDRTLMARMLVRRERGRVDQITGEHRKIIVALRCGDPDAAAAAAGDHVRMARLRLLEMLQRSSTDG